MAVADSYSLNDRYLETEGRVFLSGVQALARLPIEQLRIDRANGLNTAAFISGYPGSPLGGFDQEAARAAALVPDLPIVCQPGMNEELGATAVMGSQLASEQADVTYDGVLGMWYGKAPGLDRAGDALRHAVFAGTSQHGGAIALVGDDPAAKSSTLPSSSDATIYDLHMPLLYPGDVQEVVDLGRHAVALSRLTGLWSSMKIVTAVADGTGTVDISPGRVTPILPDTDYVHHPNGYLLGARTVEMEREFREVRSVLANEYAIENRLNYFAADPQKAWIGLVASGYTYHELLEALRRLGFTSLAEIEAAGIRILHMQMPLAVNRPNIINFARDLEEIVIVEEKNPTLEWLIKDALYGAPNQPPVVGKQHENGATLMPSWGKLDAEAMMEGLRSRLTPQLGDKMVPLPSLTRERIMIPLSVDRSPYFCSGCPHNQSTKVPEGTLVGAGIGCHGMVLLMDEDRVGESAGITSMGGEGSQWIGMSPFVERNHFTQNLGDGTYAHSGQLAIQASVAAGVNVTYKILYNGTVAMTGGQDAPGGLSVPNLTRVLLAQGVKEVLITTEDIEDYKGVDLPEGPNGRTKVWDRARMLEAQERLRDQPGVTVLIHDQACAAQARRLRKRGLIPTPTQRVVINHRICEACGDCGEVSNCLSVQAVETPLGTKTMIDQSTCNLDFSCLDGDCPSFMTVEPADPGAQTGKPRVASPEHLALLAELPDPELVVPSEDFSIRLAGIGGTGVMTVTQVLATAAMLDGYQSRGLDQTGLSQKAGPVVGDVRISSSRTPETNLIGSGEADVLLLCDLLAGTTDSVLSAAAPGRTVTIASSTETPTGSMVGRPEVDYPEVGEFVQRLDRHTRTDHRQLVNAGAVTNGLLGSTASANIFLLGVAYQAGALPIAATAVERAIELNGVAVEANHTAFRNGRLWVLDPGAVLDAAGIVDAAAPVPITVDVDPLPRRLDERVQAVDPEDVVRMLTADLIGFQSARYAGRFLDLVEQVYRLGSPELTEAVARGLHKLMAYKDEYEVARLLIGPEAKAAAEAVGGPGAAVTWRLHPPMLKALGMDSKIGISTKAGVPMMKALAKGKRLRGTPADPFGRAEVRRVERQLVGDFRDAIPEICSRVRAGTMPLEEAMRIARLPMDVRGYEDLKLRRASDFQAELKRSLHQ